jgi:CheY-like chemotaxis protein
LAEVVEHLAEMEMLRVVLVALVVVGAVVAVDLIKLDTQVHQVKGLQVAMDIRQDKIIPVVEVVEQDQQVVMQPHLLGDMVELLWLRLLLDQKFFMLVVVVAE